MNVASEPAWWGLSPDAAGELPATRSIVELVVADRLDDELAALLWLLVEGRVPIVVAGERGAGRTTLLTALLAFLPHAAERIPILAADPAAIETVRTAPAGSVLLLPELLRGEGGITQRSALARALVTTLGRAASLATTVLGGRLEDVHARLQGPSAGVPGDALSLLGTVVVLGPHAEPGAVAADPGGRVVAAHFERPLARDAHGHVQRLGPAVLATRAAPDQPLEHFAWGIYPELATRIGLKSGDLEREHDRRRGYLDGLVAGGVTDPDAVARAIDGYRHAGSARPA